VSDVDVDAIAGQLLAAYRSRTTIPPLTSSSAWTSRTSGTC
jgi:hypothetical protein